MSFPPFCFSLSSSCSLSLSLFQCKIIIYYHTYDTNISLLVCLWSPTSSLEIPFSYEFHPLDPIEDSRRALHLLKYTGKLAFLAPRHQSRPPFSFFHGLPFGKKEAGSCFSPSLVLSIPSCVCVRACVRVRLYMCVCVMWGVSIVGSIEYRKVKSELYSYRKGRSVANGQFGKRTTWYHLSPGHESGCF